MNHFYNASSAVYHSLQLNVLTSSICSHSKNMSFHAPNANTSSITPLRPGLYGSGHRHHHRRHLHRERPFGGFPQGAPAEDSDSDAPRCERRRHMMRALQARVAALEAALALLRPCLLLPKARPLRLPILTASASAAAVVAVTVTATTTAMGASKTATQPARARAAVTSVPAAGAALTVPALVSAIPALAPSASARTLRVPSVPSLPPRSPRPRRLPQSPRPLRPLWPPRPPRPLWPRPPLD